MPLKHGNSNETIQYNIKEMIAAGHDPKQAEAAAYRMAGEEAKDATPVESHREENFAGYLLVNDNPIICAGVFPYLGKQIKGAPEPERIYQVYRPLEELKKPETLNSLVGLPIIDDHEMLGKNYARGPEERGVHGAVLDNVKVFGNNILAKLSIFSNTLKALIEAGKEGLSLGYNCVWEKAIGEYQGIRYDYIQREIRGNHLALVNQGRNGTVVLDSAAVMDSFDLNLKELKMAEEKEKEKPTEANKDVPGGEKKEMGIDEVHKWIKANMPKIKEMMSVMSSEDGEEETEEALDGDTSEKSGDQAKDKAKDSEECEDEDDKEKEKEKAMDSATISKIVDERVNAGIKNARGDIITRDALVKDLTPLVGTFDSAAMDSDDVAVYGVEKLGLTADRATAKSVLTGYLAGVKKSAAGNAAFAMDSIKSPKEGGKLAARLGKTA